MVQRMKEMFQQAKKPMQSTRTKFLRKPLLRCLGHSNKKFIKSSGMAWSFISRSWWWQWLDQNLVESADICLSHKPRQVLVSLPLWLAFFKFTRWKELWTQRHLIWQNELSICFQVSEINAGKADVYKDAPRSRFLTIGSVILIIQAEEVTFQGF